MSNDASIGLLILVIAIAVGILIGANVERYDWERHCKKDGYHNVDQVRYNCAVHKP